MNSYLDHAMYDLKYRVPKRFTLVSVGKLIKESKDGDALVSECGRRDIHTLRRLRRCRAWKIVPSADRYVQYAHYDLYADPSQHVNLAGRATHRPAAEQFRVRLLSRIREASGATPKIDASWFPYS